MRIEGTGDHPQALADEWIEWLEEEAPPGLPARGALRAALAQGDWARAEREIAGSAFARSGAGIRLRFVLADARGDRAAIRALAEEIEFEAHPAEKLMLLRETGRSAEGFALVRYALDRPGFEEMWQNPDVLDEAREAASMAGAWSLVTEFSARLDAVRPLDPNRLAAWGQALEKLDRTAQAVDAYVRAYRIEPNTRISFRLVKIHVESKDPLVRERIDAFGRECAGLRSLDRNLHLLALGADPTPRGALTMVLYVIRYAFAAPVLFVVRLGKERFCERETRKRVVR